jgi:hypothetical protein
MLPTAQRIEGLCLVDVKRKKVQLTQPVFYLWRQWPFQDAGAGLPGGYILLVGYLVLVNG